MIIDRIENSGLYHSVHPKFAEAFAFIERAVKEQLPVGKYELDGKALYAMVQEYQTKAPKDARFEAHERYIDIQYLIEGVEEIDVVDIEKAELEEPYDVQKDVAFYKSTDRGTKTVYEAGDFGIFYPHDVHCPAKTVGNAPSGVRKIVVKVKK